MNPKHESNWYDKIFKENLIILAILSNFGTTSPQVVAQQLVSRLQETAGGQLALEKHLHQLRILANLRKLKPFIEQLMESITKYFKPEEDFLYKKGEELGLEKGEEAGFQKGKLEGKLEVIRKFLKEDILTTKQIASFFEVSEELVEQLRNETNT